MTAGGLEASVGLRAGTLDIEIGLRVGAGEVVAVVGPNGAGKTTLLRALAGLEALDRGRVELDGTVLDDVASGTHVPPERRQVSLSFQDCLLFPHLNVVENVAYGLRQRGTSRAIAHEAAGGWLERMGLGNRLRSRPSELSGGESQRVALARALATDPRLLLLDEPLSALDVSTRAEIRRVLRTELEASTAATVIVTHNPVEAMTLADRLVVVENGGVIQHGAPAEIAARPRSRYVAEFVGLNLFRGRSDGDRIDVEEGGWLIVPGTTSGEVFAAVHPRAVTLYRTEPDGSPRNIWKGIVDDVDLEGDRARVRVAGSVPIISEITLAAATELEVAPGLQVWVAVKATEVSVYLA
jgi:molybdate transport system ATP-binding protein